jgi:hypothetical protein
MHRFQPGLRRQLPAAIRRNAEETRVSPRMLYHFARRFDEYEAKTATVELPGRQGLVSQRRLP